jgi:hypothetical protein
MGQDQHIAVPELGKFDAFHQGATDAGDQVAGAGQSVKSRVNPGPSSFAAAERLRTACADITVDNAAALNELGKVLRTVGNHVLEAGNALIRAEKERAAGIPVHKKAHEQKVADATGAKALHLETQKHFKEAGKAETSTGV